MSFEDDMIESGYNDPEDYMDYLYNLATSMWDEADRREANYRDSADIEESEEDYKQKDYQNYLNWLGTNSYEVKIFCLENGIDDNSKLTNKKFFTRWESWFRSRNQRDCAIDVLCKEDLTSIENILKMELIHSAFVDFISDVSSPLRVIGLYQMIAKWKVDNPQYKDNFYLPTYLLNNELSHNCVEIIDEYIKSIKQPSLDLSVYHDHDKINYSFLDGTSCEDLDISRLEFWVCRGVFNQTSWEKWIRKQSDFGYFKNDWESYVNKAIDRICSQVWWGTRIMPYEDLHNKVKKYYSEEFRRRIIWKKLSLFNYGKSKIFHDELAVMRIRSGELYSPIPQFCYVDRNESAQFQDTYDDAREFVNGVAFVQKGVKYNVYQDPESGMWEYDSYGGLWGLIDLDGQYIIKPKYSQLGCFIAGCAPYSVGGTYRRGHDMWLYEGGKWGLISESGEEIIAPIYDWMRHCPDKPGYLIICKDDGCIIQFGLIDKDGNLIIPLQSYESTHELLNHINETLGG